ncbi:MAG: hypothetical protein KDJ27_19165 [Gammaproteobacteria bacterium]|nr:hypothetical protein [Gammaproteobacteria bacterium]
MPLFETPDDAFYLGERNPYTDPKSEPQPWHEKWAAGLAQQNPLSGLVRYGIQPSRPPEPGYNALDDDDLRDYDPRDFIGAKSPQETQDIKDRTDRQRADREMLSQNRGVEIASGVVGAFGNPVLWPGLALAPHTIAGAMALEAGSEVMSEMILHQQQPERTTLESAINVGAATVVAGAFGALAARMSPAEIANAEQAVAREAHTGEHAVEQQPLSVGAAEVQRTTLEQESLATGPFNFMADLPGIGRLATAPGGRVMTESQSPTMRRFVQEVETIYRTNAHEQGIAQPLTFQSLMGQADADDAFMLKAFDQQFAAFRRAGGQLTEDQFDEAVQSAMRNGDQHAIPQVAEVARTYRKLISPKFDEAVQSGAYGNGAMERYARAVQEAEDADDFIPTPSQVLRPKGATSYAPRIYSREALRDPAKRAAFRTLLQGKLLDAITTSGANRSSRMVIKIPADQTVDGGKPGFAIIEADEIGRYRKLYPDLQVVTGGMRSFDAVRSDADKIAAAILDNIEGGPVDTLALDYIVPKAGALHQRTLDFITDQELERVGVLVKSARDVIRHHNREMIRELSFGRLWGERDLRGLKREVDLEYEPLIRSAEAAGSLDEIEKLKAARANDERTIDLFRDRMTGTHQTPQDPTSIGTNISRGLRVYNTVTLLLGTLLANLGDVVAPALRHGSTPVLKELGSYLTNVSRFKQAKEIANTFGLAVESVTGARISAIMEGAGPQTQMQAKALQFFGKVSGMNLLTDIAQTASAMVGSRRIAKLSADYANLQTKDIARLAEIGIDEPMARRIADQWSQFAQNTRGVMDPRTMHWDDKEAALLFENAVRRDTRLTIVQPGIIETPAWMDSGEFGEFGKLLGQFARFNYSVTQRWLVAGWQRRDAEFFSGMLSLLVMGAVTESLKSGVRGDDVTDKQASEMLVGAIDRSGVLGLPGIVLSAGYGLATGNRASRYLVREPWEAFTGPGPSHAARVTYSLGKLVVGEGNENDMWTVLKGVPYLNTLHFIDLLRLAADGPGWRDKQ